MILWHGSEKIVEFPQFGLGKIHNDYGQGFYCSENADLAKEWACSSGIDGYANRYDLKTDGLRLLDLTSSDYSILHWITLLIEHRSFRKDSAMEEGAAEYLSEHFSIDIDSYDLIRGWRADDSYFSYARAFLSNSISMEQLGRAMKLGNLGEQVVLKSKRAFSQIHFKGVERAPYVQYGPLRMVRDREARAGCREMLNEDPFGGLRIVDIVRGGVTEHDLRIR